MKLFKALNEQYKKDMLFRSPCSEKNTLGKDYDDKNTLGKDYDDKNQEIVHDTYNSQYSFDKNVDVKLESLEVDKHKNVPRQLQLLETYLPDPSPQQRL